MHKEIRGKNVILRERRPEDAAFFAYWYNQPKVMFQCGFTEPRCQMYMETFPGSLKDKGGYVVYDMYFNA